MSHDLWDLWAMSSWCLCFLIHKYRFAFDFSIFAECQINPSHFSFVSFYIKKNCECVRVYKLACNTFINGFI